MHAYMRRRSASGTIHHPAPPLTNPPPRQSPTNQAVMISHDNLTWTVKNFIEALPFTLTCEDRSVSYLPLSHVAAQVIQQHHISV